MAALDIDIGLDDRLTGRLRRAVAAATDLSRPMTAIAGELLKSTKARFASESGPDGTPWAPRKDKNNPKKLLFASGDLSLRGVTSESGADFAAVGVLKSGGPGIYAAIHQFGGTIRPKKSKALKTPFGIFGSVTVPARSFLGFNDADRTRVSEILTSHLRAAFEGEGQGE